MSKCSVVIPVYNAGRYLRQCLDSVLNQSYADWEAICVNDGSEDDSGSVLDEAASSDPRIKVIHQENRGALNDDLRLSLADAVWDGVLFTLNRLDPPSRLMVEKELRRGVSTELGLDLLTAETCRSKNWSALTDFRKRV